MKSCKFLYSSEWSALPAGDTYFVVQKVKKIEKDDNLGPHILDERGLSQATASFVAVSQVEGEKPKEGVADPDGMVYFMRLCA